MSKAGVVGCLAAAIALGLSVSGALGQETVGSTSGGATAASSPSSAPPAAMRVEVIVPPVRRVRPKTPPGPVAVPKAKDAAPHKGSAAVRRGAVFRVAAGGACVNGAVFSRKLKRCERKNGAKTARGRDRGAPSNRSAANRKR